MKETNDKALIKVIGDENYYGVSNCVYHESIAIGLILSQKVETMYHTSLNHLVVCNVVVEVIWLVCVTLIPLNNFASTINIIVSKIHVWWQERLEVSLLFWYGILSLSLVNMCTRYTLLMTFEISLVFTICLRRQHLSFSISHSG